MIRKSHDMSLDDVCAIVWRRCEAAKGVGKKGSNGAGTWHRGKKLMNGRAAKEVMQEERTPRGANPICTVTTTKDPMDAKVRTKAKARTKSVILAITEMKDTSE